MSQRNFISKEELSMMRRYLFYTFAIAWGTEFLLIMLYRFNLLSENITLFLYFTAIGFGAGMAPAYAAFIVQRKQTGIKLKAFLQAGFSYVQYAKKHYLFAAIRGDSILPLVSYRKAIWAIRGIYLSSLYL